MIFCNTLRYEGKKGIKFVSRREDGFIGVSFDTDSGENNLEFSPPIFALLAEGIKDVAIGKDYKGPDGDARVKPDISLHLAEEKLEIGFESRDGYNPVNEDWPTIILRNKDVQLAFSVNPDQAKAIIDCCQQVVGLGAAVDAVATGMLKEEAA